MPFESLKARMAMLLEQMIHQPEDMHELQETLREELAELRASGLPVPLDLVELEQRLEDQLNLPKKGK
ncbi:MAG: hypothetical protein KAS85_00325 [Rhodobacteraceae bacterium]|jgi:hypothetical protein|nr:hypothetical protein [Paracoccaceae bacterium]PCJ77014.1 MAG: hypothetical protein COA53_02060 [Paracoccaceae bacterium]